MRKALLLLVLVCSHPFFAKAQSNPPVYDHRIIAVLPVRAVLAEYRNLSDSSIQAFRALEVKYGGQLQEALYQTITGDTNRILVEVQPWQTTDSILKRAGIDPLKIPWLDISAIAKVLKVDACIVTIMGRTRQSPTTVFGGSTMPVMLATGVATTAASALMNRANRDNKVFRFSLMDGKSGNEIWTFTQTVMANELVLEKDKMVFSSAIFKKFKKRFPYCD
jgi:hypothetical protein